MLAEDRLEKIVALVNEHGSITATDLMQLLDASESTIRRDLTRLAQMGRIVKVHGGATAVTRTVVSSDQTVYEKYSVHLEEKTAIARFAATLIGPDDFVYIDAGSTTERLVDFITETRATYFTNSISVAHALLSRGCRVLVPAGELKPVTEALVGEQTVDTLRRYHFTIGFFGTNGATPDEGFTHARDRRGARQGDGPHPDAPPVRTVRFQASSRWSRRSRSPTSMTRRS